MCWKLLKQDQLCIQYHADERKHLHVQCRLQEWKRPSISRRKRKYWKDQFLELENTELKTRLRKDCELTDFYFSHKFKNHSQQIPWLFNDCPGLGLFYGTFQTLRMLLLYSRTFQDEWQNWDHNNTFSPKPRQEKSSSKTFHAGTNQLN